MANNIGNNHNHVHSRVRNDHVGHSHTNPNLGTPANTSVNNYQQIDGVSYDGGENTFTGFTAQNQQHQVQLYRPVADLGFLGGIKHYFKNSSLGQMYQAYRKNKAAGAIGALASKLGFNGAQVMNMVKAYKEGKVDLAARPLLGAVSNFLNIDQSHLQGLAGAYKIGGKNEVLSKLLGNIAGNMGMNPATFAGVARGALANDWGSVAGTLANRFGYNGNMVGGMISALQRGDTNFVTKGALGMAGHYLGADPKLMNQAMSLFSKSGRQGLATSVGADLIAKLGIDRGTANNLLAGIVNKDWGRAAGSVANHLGYDGKMIGGLVDGISKGDYGQLIGKAVEMTGNPFGLDGGTVSNLYNGFKQGGTKGLVNAGVAMGVKYLAEKFGDKIALDGVAGTLAAQVASGNYKGAIKTGAGAIIGKSIGGYWGNLAQSAMSGKFDVKTLLKTAAIEAGKSLLTSIGAGAAIPIIGWAYTAFQLFKNRKMIGMLVKKAWKKIKNFLPIKKVWDHVSKVGSAVIKGVKKIGSAVKKVAKKIKNKVKSFFKGL